MKLINENRQYIWWETINYFVFHMDIMRDISKVIDYLKVRSLHTVTSYFWWEKSNIYIREGEGDKNRKNSKKLIS